LLAIDFRRNVNFRTRPCATVAGARGQSASTLSTLAGGDHFREKPGSFIKGVSARPWQAVPITRVQLR